jgi:exonuclease III
MASTNGQMPGINCLAGVTIASKNCNSLNMSHSMKQNQLLKVEALASLRADIIFLSDIRLGNKNSTGSTGDISRLFLINSTGTYDFLSNSTQNKRGVGMLLKKELAIKTLRTIPDPEENFIAVLMEIKNVKLIMASIYGPNSHNPYFFQNLYRAIIDLGNFPVIIGGDFVPTNSICT